MPVIRKNYNARDVNTTDSYADAKNRKKEVEYKESVGTFVAPQCRTLLSAGGLGCKGRCQGSH